MVLICRRRRLLLHRASHPHHRRFPRLDRLFHPQGTDRSLTQDDSSVVVVLGVDRVSSFWAYFNVTGIYTILRSGPWSDSTGKEPSLPILTFGRALLDEEILIFAHMTATVALLFLGSREGGREGGPVISATAAAVAAAK